MKFLEVNCIAKTGRGNNHRQITHIGNSAQGWRLSVAEAIAQIEAEAAAFYTVHKLTGMRAYLGVIREPGGSEYLMARVGGIWNKHLLIQGQCPA